MAAVFAKAQSPAPQQSSLAALLPPVSADGQKEDMIDSLVLRDAPLDLVIDRLEVWTGRIILRPQALPTAMITLNINSPVTRAEAVRAIESVLALNNIGVVPMGEKYLKIIELANRTKLEGPELIDGSTLQLPPSGKSASKIFTLSYLKAADIIPQLNTMLNAQIGGAVLFVNTNSFMVTESIANLQRIERILTEIDRPGDVTMKPLFVVLQNAKPTELLPRLQAILQGPAQTQVGVNYTLAADDRTNQIIVFVNERRHGFFTQIIDRLDAKADPNTVNEVIYLNNAEAATVVKRLTELISGQAAAANRAGANKRTQTTTVTTGGQRTQQAAATSRTNTSRQRQAAAASAAPAPTTIKTVSAPGQGVTSDFSPLLSVVADERANAVIITGTPNDVILIKDLVGKLDVTLLQVRIEVVVAEVRLRDAASTGIDSLGFIVEGNKLTGFAFAGPGFSIGGNASLKNGKEGYMARNGGSLSGIIGLTTTPRKSLTNIISTPSIVTSHNKEAYIFVGEQRPVISSYLNDNVNTSSGSGYRSTISMLDIGLQLTVTPLIGKDGSVQLSIKQKVDDVVGETEIDGNKQPIIGRRETQSYVTAKNGEIIVLGGLQRKDNSASTSRLGPIPFIGDLLGARSKEKNRHDLIFFLRPVILTGDAEKDNAKAFEAIEEMINKTEIKKFTDPAGSPTPPNLKFKNPKVNNS